MMTWFQQTYKGDMYVRDSAKTFGHTHAINDGCWHPTDIDWFATCSLDGTVRLWNVESKREGLDQALPSLVVLKAVDRRGATISRECGVGAVVYMSPQIVAGGCSDDSIQIWDSRINNLKSRKPQSVLRGFHESQSISDLATPTTRGSHTLYSRTTDFVTRKRKVGVEI